MHRALTPGYTRRYAGVVMQPTMVRAFAVMSLGVSAWCAGPPLTPQQIQSAINEASEVPDGQNKRCLLASKKKPIHAIAI